MIHGKMARASFSLVCVNLVRSLLRSVRWGRVVFTRGKFEALGEGS